MEEYTDCLTLTDENFDREILNSEMPVVVNFWADWCGPSHIIRPAIEKLAAEYKGRVKFAKMNIDRNVRVPSEYSLRSLPALFFFKEGRIIFNILAYHAIKKAPKQLIAEKLNTLLQQPSRS